MPKFKDGNATKITQKCILERRRKKKSVEYITVDFSSHFLKFQIWIRAEQTIGHIFSNFFFYSWHTNITILQIFLFYPGLLWFLHTNPFRYHVCMREKRRAKFHLKCLADACELNVWHLCGWIVYIYDTVNLFDLEATISLKSHTIHCHMTNMI